MDGGQGYSYVENAKITINDGNLAKSYVTAGGSNGYTKNANINVYGGKINFLQTVNRGKIENANIKIYDGEIKDAYVGGEYESTVNGEVLKVEYDIVGGNVENLYTGTNKKEPLVIDQNNYKVITKKDTVKNNFLGDKKIEIEYGFEIIERDIVLKVNEKKKINYTIKTVPEGYEYIFDDLKIQWNIDDEEIINMDDNQIITGLKKGGTNINGVLLDKQDSINVTVINSNVSLLLALVLVILFMILMIFSLLFN